MARIVTPSGVFDSVVPDSERSFEEAVVSNAHQIFGAGRHYIDCKRRIGVKGGKYNIPDGYLIDLRRNNPRLFVVKNELSRHDLFKRIGVQTAEFSFSYRQAGRLMKQVLFEEVSKLPEVRALCEEYAQGQGYRNLDNLLDYLVFETPFKRL